MARGIIKKIVTKEEEFVMMKALGLMDDNKNKLKNYFATKELKEELAQKLSLAIMSETRCLKSLLNPSIAERQMFNIYELQNIKIKSIKGLLREFIRVINKEEDYKILNKGLEIIGEQKVKENQKHYGGKITKTEINEISEALDLFGNREDQTYEDAKKAATYKRENNSGFMMSY